jgi:hypothetical protein
VASAAVRVLSVVPQVLALMVEEVLVVLELVVTNGYSPVVPLPGHL